MRIYCWQTAVSMCSGFKCSQFKVAYVKPVFLLGLSLLLTACLGAALPFKAYIGEQRDSHRLALFEGEVYTRNVWINRYQDSVRFYSVDDNTISMSENYASIQVEPGFHDIRVYFSWDMGSERGLAPALVNYAASRETTSRTPRLNALAGSVYRVRGEPVFEGDGRDITSLAYVNFWIEDDRGNIIVSKEDGKYIPAL